MRESPSVHVMERLRALGAEVAYSDPHVPVFPKMREHHFDLSSQTLTAEILSDYDCVILTTAHDCFDYELIARHAPLLIDTRGHYREPQPHIVKA